MLHTIWITPCFAPARVRFNSPSGCPSFPRAVADWNFDRTWLKFCAKDFWEHPYNIHRHAGSMAQYCCRPINFRNIDQNLWSEPDPKTLSSPPQKKTIERASSWPVISSVILPIRNFIVCGRRIVCPCLLCHNLLRDSLLFQIKHQNRLGPHEALKGKAHLKVM